MPLATAKLKNLPISARKVRLVATLIRGKKVSHARDILHFTLKGSAEPMLKLLESAVANAENEAVGRRARIDTDAMVIRKITVDEGRTLQRWYSAPRGRGTRVRHRSSHIQLEIYSPAEAEDVA